MFKDSTRPQAVPPQCCGKFRWKGKRLLSEKILSSKADLAVEKDKIISLSFFKEVAGRSFHVKQQEIYCYHKRKEIECMQSLLQEGIKMPHPPLPLLGLTLTDTQADNTASVRAFIGFGSKRKSCLSLKLRQLHCCLAAEVAVCARLGKATPVWDFQLQSALTLERVGVCILTKLTSLPRVLSAVMDLPGALFKSMHCVHQ